MNDVGVLSHCPKTFEDIQREAGRRNLDILSSPGNPVMLDEHFLGYWFAAKCQYLRLDTIGMGLLAQLKYDLFDSTRGVWEVGFKEVENAHRTARKAKRGRIFQQRHRNFNNAGLYPFKGYGQIFSLIAANPAVR